MQIETSLVNPALWIEVYESPDRPTRIAASVTVSCANRKRISS